MNVDRIQSFLLTIICIWMLMPIFSFEVFYRIIVVAATLFYIFLEITRRNSAFLSIPKDCVLVIAFIFISVVFFSISEILIYQSGFLIFTFLLFVFWLKKDKTIMFYDHAYFVLLIMFLTLLSSIYFVSFVDSHAARIIVRTSDLAKEYTSNNVGGYGFVYTCLLILPAIFFEMRKQYRLKNNFKLSFLILFFLLACSFIFLGGYTIALAGLLLALLLLVPLFKRRIILFGLLTLPIGLIIFLGDGLIYLMPSFALDLLEGTSYNTQLKSIIFYDPNDLVVNDSFEVRRERYLRSFNIFLDNFFTGKFDFNSVGKHSTILDLSAMYGIFFISFFFLLLFRYLQFLYYSSGSRLVLVTGYLFTYIIMLNNLVPHFAAVLFILLPSLVKNNQEKDTQILN